MILTDLMQKGFLTRGEGTKPKNSQNSQNSRSRDFATNKKSSISLYKNTEFHNPATAIPAIPAIFVNHDMLSNCPLKTGIVPDACRFHPKLFKRLVAEGTLRMGGKCPIVGVCKMKADP